MTAAIIAGLLAFVVVGVILARNTSMRKKRAIKSLEEEKDTIGHYSIIEMVGQEVRDLGLRDIPGSEDISSEALLKVWRESESTRKGCAQDALVFTIANGIPAAEATSDDVQLECTQARSETVDAQPSEMTDEI